MFLVYIEVGLAASPPCSHPLRLGLQFSYPQSHIFFSFTFKQAALAFLIINTFYFLLPEGQVTFPNSAAITSAVVSYHRSISFFNFIPLFLCSSRSSAPGPHLSMPSMIFLCPAIHPFHLNLSFLCLSICQSLYYLFISPFLRLFRLFPALRNHGPDPYGEICPDKMSLTHTPMQTQPAP